MRAAVIWTPLNDRVHYRDTFDGFELRIPTRRHWWTVAVLLYLWLPYTIGGFAAIVSGKMGGAFLLIGLWPWLAGALGMAVACLWMAFGAEIVTISRGVLSVRDDVLGCGLTRRFYAHGLKNLRVAAPLQDTDPIAFEVGSKTHRFGGPLDERQAREVIQTLRSHLPEDAFAVGYGHEGF